MPPGYFGAWISDAEDPLEYIFFNTNATSPVHQLHIKLHELSHILCGHNTLKVTAADIRQVIQWGGALPPGAICRSADTGPREQEAETLAILISVRVSECRSTQITSSSETGIKYLRSII